MIFSKDFLDNIDHWEHRVDSPTRLSSTVAPKVYDVFTISFKKFLRPKKVITVPRKISKVNAVWEHTPAPYAIQVHNELKTVGETEPTQLRGPENIA